MPDLPFRLVTLSRELDGGFCLAEPLSFPGILRFGDRARAVRRAVEKAVRTALHDDPALDVHRHALPEEIRIETVAVDVAPPPRSERWRRPVTITFHVVRFDHGPRYARAWVPALGCEVVGPSDDAVTHRLPDELRFAMARRKALTSLAALVELERCRTCTLDASVVTVGLRTTKQRAVDEASDGPVASAFHDVAENLTTRVVPPAYEVDDLVARLADALRPPRQRSVLLVGPAGSGKTAVFHELVRRRREYGLGDRLFWATTGSRIVAGQAGFGMWQQRCTALVTEAARLHHVVHVGSLVELVEAGRSELSSLGVATFLQPAVERGEFIAVCECTADELAAVERSHPGVVRMFHHLPVDPPDDDRGRSILLQCALENRPADETAIEVEGLETLDRLHGRFATYSAYPGRPLRFLRNLLRDEEQARAAAGGGPGRPLTSADVTAAFARETGLPTFMLDDGERLDLSATSRWFGERVIGQPEAVARGLSALAAAKADVGRPNRPLASFLFIGPTGVGKT